MAVACCCCLLLLLECFLLNNSFVVACYADFGLFLFFFFFPSFSYDIMTGLNYVHSHVHVIHKYTTALRRQRFICWKYCRTRWRKLPRSVTIWKSKISMSSLSVEDLWDSRQSWFKWKSWRSPIIEKSWMDINIEPQCIEQSLTCFSLIQIALLLHSNSNSITLSYMLLQERIPIHISNSKTLSYMLLLFNMLNWHLKQERITDNYKITSSWPHNMHMTYMRYIYYIYKYTV